MTGVNKTEKVLFFKCVRTKNIQLSGHFLSRGGFHVCTWQTDTKTLMR